MHEDDRIALAFVEIGDSDVSVFECRAWGFPQGRAADVLTLPGRHCQATILLSTTKAERVEGGYRFTGRKSFGSLSPVWTYLGIHGIDMADASKPTIVHAFMPRDTEGYRIEQTWDVLGMRATRSDDTILDGVFVPDRYIGRVVPAGAAGIDGFVLGLFAWALIGFGNIYYGLARRALDMTIDTVKTKRSVAIFRTMAYHADLQHRIAEMGLAFETIGPHLDRVAEDWSNGVDHGATWPAKIFAAKYHAVEDRGAL